MPVPLRTSEKAQPRAAGSLEKRKRTELIRSSIAKHGLTNTFAINKDLYTKASGIETEPRSQGFFSRSSEAINRGLQSDAADYTLSAIGEASDLYGGATGIWKGSRELANQSTSAADKAGHIGDGVGTVMDLVDLGQNAISLLDTYCNPEATKRDKHTAIADTVLSGANFANSAIFTGISQANLISDEVGGISPCISGTIDIIGGLIKIYQATQDKSRLDSAATQDGLDQLDSYVHHAVQSFDQNAVTDKTSPTEMISALAEEKQNRKAQDANANTSAFDQAIRGIMRMMQIKPTVAMAKGVKSVEQFQGTMDCISGACSILSGILQAAGVAAAGVGTIIAASCQAFVSTVLNVVSFVGTRSMMAKNAQKNVNQDLSQILSIHRQMFSRKAAHAQGSAPAPADTLKDVTDIDSLTEKIIEENKTKDNADYNIFSSGKRRSYMSKICYELGSVERSPKGLANNLAVNRAAQIRIYASREDASPNQAGTYEPYRQMLYGMGILKTDPQAKLPSVETIAEKLGFKSSIDIDKLIKVGDAGELEETQVFYTDEAASSNAQANADLRTSDQKYFLMRNQEDTEYKRPPAATP